jgi:L-iditol 2-dehydrogenase
MTKMRAALWTDYNKLEIRDLDKPVPQDHEVLVRVMSAGLCITDLHVYTGKLAYGKPPHVLGHEISGEICEAGKKVNPRRIGERVVIETSIGCGTCLFCKSGRRHLCPHMEEIGTAPHQGGYAQYIKVPAENAIPIPDNMSWDEAGIMESVVCPMGTLMRNGIGMGETVAVYGVGPAGLAFIQGARALGAGKVIAIARNTERLARAKHFGADILINSSEENVIEKILAETGDIGADVVCEAAGATETITQSFDIVRKAGRVYLYGLPGDGEPIQFPVMKINLNQLEIYGAVGEPRVWEPLIKLIGSGRINLKDMITHRVPLADIARGFEIMKDKKENPIKIVLHPQE